MAANLLHLAQIVSTRPAAFAIASVWQGLLLTALAWLGLEAIPKTVLGKAWQISPRTRFLLWMSVFVLSALLPFTTFFHSASGHMPAGTRAVVPAAHLSASWAVALSCVWALATLVSLSRLFISGFRLHRILCGAEVIAPESLSTEMQAVLGSARPGAAPVALALSRSVDSPMVIGFFHRTIVLPEWLWTKLNSAELSQVILHETAHLTRGDDWTNLLQKTLRALFPLNPALFFAERRLCWEREMACDDAVLDRSVNPREYALCLTSLAEKGILNRLQTLAPGAWRRRSELAERVHRILRSNPRLKPLRSRPAAAGFLTVLLCAGAALTRCPQLVTFTVADSATSLARPSEPAAHVERASFSTNSGFNQPTAAHLVEASLRIPVARHAFQAGTPRRPQQRRTAAARRAHLRTMQPARVQGRLIQTAFLTGELQPVPVPNSPRIFFAVYGVTLSADGSVSLSNLPSQSGWIIVQL